MPTQGSFDQSYPALLLAENKIRLLQPFSGAKAHHQMQCLICDHIWTATPISKRQTLKKHGVTGCPNCNDQRKEANYATYRTANLEQLKQRGIQVLDDSYDGRRHVIDEYSYTKIKVRNVACGHEFLCSPSNLLTQNVQCGVCGPQKRVATLTAWSKANSAKWKQTATQWQKYKAEVTALTEQAYKKHSKIINPNNVKRGKAGVEGAYHLDHRVPKRFCFDNAIPPKICADRSNLQMVGWRENVGSRNHIKGVIPPLFLNYLATNTKLEQYSRVLLDMFPSAKPFVQVGDVVTTVYDETNNYAIIVLPIDNTYANLKSGKIAHDELSALGVRFTILFEDELNNADLLKSKLQHYAHNSVVTRVHARDCTIRPCTIDEKRALLNANHVQGDDNARFNYGAFYQDKLLAVMTFSQPRVALGQKGSGSKAGRWELSRFCTDVNYRIPGVASKLLTHFKRNHQWCEIYSYADKRWSIGNMYDKLGFQLVRDNPPDYFYVIDGKRKHRWNYRKDILKHTLERYDPSLTEYQNMVNHGYYRVWDCGTLKYAIENVSQ